MTATRTASHEVTWDFDNDGAPPSYTPYQLTLSGLIYTEYGHWLFDFVAGACLAMLGHLYIGLAVALTNCVADSVFQRRFRAMMLQSAAVRSEDGLRRLAWMMAGRSALYIVAPAAAALQSGNVRTVIYACIVASTLVAVAIASGSFSRKVFWAIASPALATIGGGCVMSFGPMAAAPLIVALASFCATLQLISSSTVRVMNRWDGAHQKTVQLVSDLRKARDTAEAERCAADEAREEARRANKAKSNFLATMSHEIRTPMNGVLGMAQVMRTEAEDPRQIARIDTLIHSGEYLLSILNDILDLSKIDAGKLELQPKVEDLQEFTRRLVIFWESRAAEKGLDLRLELDDSAPRHVLMDALRVRQVLFNLVGNALKFTEAGEVRVRLDAAPLDEARALVRFTVSDSGVGISADMLPNLFERFSQADDESAARRYGGTGLGLAISRQLVELMGGDIAVDSAPGCGSTFHVSLPLMLAQPEVQSESAEPQGPAPLSLKILAVDDNAVNLLVLEQLLAAFGHDVMRSSSGADALERLAVEPVDLVLMDIQMPGMTGIEALARLRSVAGPNRQTPVVALTADVVTGGRDKYVALGFDDHASKPIQISDLLAAIGRAVHPGLSADAA